jgi:Uma2 family endonuclease
MTWEEICEDKLLATLPYRIESDRWGHIVMSPPAFSHHAEYQGEITAILSRNKNGRALPECPIKTDEGVKAADVAWVSHERRASRPNHPVYLIAPEICVEIFSESNTDAEMEERKRLFFAKGAVEFWLCGFNGEISFFDPAGPIPNSRLFPDFPSQLNID